MMNLYNKDCLGAMKHLPANTYDLAIIDPPYGIGEDGSKNHSRSNLAKAKNYKAYYGNDKKAPSREYFNELFRVSKNQIIFGANHFIENMPIRNSSSWIVWDKINGENDFADCELAWTSFKSSVRLFRFMWNGMMQGKSLTEGYVQQGNKKLNEKRIHPNQKPVALYKWIFSTYANHGDKILDSHVGSGSSVIACHDLGLDIDAFEIDTTYYHKMHTRVNKYINENQLLFKVNI